MTTDRDMERARETLDATYDEMPLFTRAVTKAQETAAANIIAAALAAERAPLEARIAELAKLLAEARWALRDLLAGLSLDDAPRRAAIDRARETVRRWDAGEPQRPVAWIEEERAPHAVGDRVRANLDGVWHAGDVLGVENIAGPGSPPRWRYLVRVDPGVGYLGNTVWAYTVERIDEEPQVTGHCPTCATVALERERAEGQREMLRAALRDEQTASHRELEGLRAKLAETERERDGLREEADQVDRLRDDEHDRANAAENERDDARAEVERLRAGHRASNAEIERLTNLAGARGGEVERLRAELARIRHHEVDYWREETKKARALLDLATCPAKERPAEVERLKAELAYARRAAIMPEPILAAAEERGARWGIAAFAAKARAWGHWDVAHMLDAADVVRAAREREAAETKSEPPKVGDRVRVVRCCAPGGDDHDDCASFEGHAGTLEDIHEGSDEPFRVEGINGEGWGWFAEVERVDELQITAAECDEMVTRADLDAFRGELVAAMREAFPIGTGYGDPPSIAHGFRRLADKLESGR